ncbi:helix-turn-helix domain-containing protein [Streptomyces vinaceus]|uniref:helix-turn-helix domain-containing protein n=1 Tax=Streptomyces vinaceus TaxID=1960 RepID=UPI00380EFCB8
MPERYDLAALAGAFQISTRTLLRRFAEETGRSPLAHLQAARVRRARHLLETTDRTVAAVAAAAPRSGSRPRTTAAATTAAGGPSRTAAVDRHRVGDPARVPGGPVKRERSPARPDGTETGFT